MGLGLARLPLISRSCWPAAWGDTDDDGSVWWWAVADSSSNSSSKPQACRLQEQLQQLQLQLHQAASSQQAGTGGATVVGHRSSSTSSTSIKRQPAAHSRRSRPASGTGREGGMGEYKVAALEVLQGQPRPEEARDILTRVAKQVGACMMRARGGTGWVNE